MSSLATNINKRPLNLQTAMPKEPRKESQRVRAQGLIHERFLPLKGFHGAATRQRVLFEACVRDLGKEFRGRSQPSRAPRIAPV